MLGFGKKNLIPYWDKFEKEGSFVTKSSLSIGYSQDIVLPVKSGTYFSYFMSAEEDDLFIKQYEKAKAKGLKYDWPPSDLVLIHESYLDEIHKLYSIKEKVGSFPIDGASYPVVDSSIFSDLNLNGKKNFFEEYFCQGGHGVIKNKGVLISLSDDGSGNTYIAKKNSETVLVNIQS